MGVWSVTRKPLKDAMMAVLQSHADRERRKEALRRTLLYRDCAERVLRDDFHQYFQDSTRRARMAPFAKIGAANAIFKRTVNEVAGPVYSTSPLRSIYAVGTDENGEPGLAPSPSAQRAFDALAKEMRLNQRMDLACRSLIAHNTVFLHPRYSDRLGMRLEVMTPEIVSVIPDPEDPTTPIAISYETTGLDDQGRTQKIHVIWDDQQALRLTAGGEIVSVLDKSGKRVPMLDTTNGHPGVLPFIVVHGRERSGEFWDTTTGNDLVAAQSAAGLLTAMAVRLNKTQGHKQLKVKGDVPRDQTLDDESPIFIGGDEQADVNVLHNEADASGFLKTIDHIVTATAANWGINRDRLNQSMSEVVDSVGLLERRAETIKIFQEAEWDLFTLLKVVSKQHRDPGKRISEEATLLVDFAEISTKVDRMKLLAIWKEEISMGMRNLYDCIREQNPEIQTVEQAQAEIMRNAEARAWFIDLYRKLNISTDHNLDEPGQSARTNGAMGPAVRDGKMTKDDAAKASMGPTTDESDVDSPQ